MCIIEDIENGEEMKEVKQEEQSAATKRNVDVGARLLALANGALSESDANASKDDGEDGDKDPSTSSDNLTLQGPKRCCQQRISGSSSGLEKFVEALKESDLGCIELDARRLDLKERKHKEMNVQR